MPRSICQTLKRTFPEELKLIRRQTSSNGHEFGFPVCLNGKRPSIGKIVEGGSHSVLIPGCVEGQSLAMIHSHQHSPEMERRLGPMIRHYTGNPSAMDLRPHPTLRFGCVVSNHLLVCSRKPKESKPAIERLKIAEDTSNSAFTAWQRGEISDRTFKKSVATTVNAQKAALRSAGSYCTTQL